MLRTIVIGSGGMARRRATALLNTGAVELCGVASANAANAERFAQHFNVPYFTTDYKTLAKRKPKVALIEVPHHVQDAAVRWALQQNLHVLIGSCLATDEANGNDILRLAAQKNRIVECGFEARYKTCWHVVRQIIESGKIGRLAFINAIALWNPPADSWYLDQSKSGGMPLTHMSYAFINPLRWLLGEPEQIFASANKVYFTQPAQVTEETCMATLRFRNRVMVSLTASYLNVASAPRWFLDFHGTDGLLTLHPGEFDPGHIKVHAGTSVPYERRFTDVNDPFDAQASAFINAIQEKSPAGCRNCPEDAIHDIRIANAIVESAKTSTIQNNDRGDIF